MKALSPETVQKAKLGGVSGAVGTVIVWAVQTLLGGADVPPEVAAALHVIVLWVVMTIVGYVTPKPPVIERRAHGRVGIGARMVALALMFSAGGVAVAQDVTVQTASTEATIEVTPRSVRYTLHGEEVELPRDLIAAAQIPRAQYALWDLDMLLTLAERQGAELTYMTTDDLLAAIEDLEAAVSALEAERDGLAADVSRLEAEASGLEARVASLERMEADYIQSLARVRALIDRLSE